MRFLCVELISIPPPHTHTHKYHPPPSPPPSPNTTEDLLLLIFFYLILKQVTSRLIKMYYCLPFFFFFFFLIQDWNPYASMEMSRFKYRSDKFRNSGMPVQMFVQYQNPYTCITFLCDFDHYDFIYESYRYTNMTYLIYTA